MRSSHAKGISSSCSRDLKTAFKGALMSSIRWDQKSERNWLLIRIWKTFIHLKEWKLTICGRRNDNNRHYVKRSLLEASYHLQVHKERFFNLDLASKYTSKRSILTLKPRADIIRNPKQGYQLSTKKLMYSKIFKNKTKKTVQISSTI